jgi:hypothetical protein
MNIQFKNEEQEGNTGLVWGLGTSERGKVNGKCKGR